MARSLLILGTSLFAHEVRDLAEAGGEFKVAGFVENLDRGRTAAPLDGLPVLWFEDALPLARSHLAIGSLGTTRRRGFLEAAERAGFEFATVVHPAAQVSRRASLGPGTLVGAGVVIGAGTGIGRHVILNRGALIGHDAAIGDFVTIGPGANIAGATRIGDGSYIAMSAVLLDRVRVGSGALVAAASLVTRDVPDRCEVRGLPARIVRRDIEGR